VTGPAAVAPSVEEYLAEITARLPGSARTRAGIVAELRSGLLDAMDARVAAGLPAADAAAAAISEFGDPFAVAGGFRAEIAAGIARRVSIALLATGPLVGLLWIAAAAASHLAPRVRWTALPRGLAAGLPPVLAAGLLLVAAAAAVTACGALTGIAVTGQLSRWLNDRPRRAPAAAAVAGFGAVGADALGLALLAAQLATAPGKLSPAAAAAAAAASAARIVLARRAARQCLAMRAALT